MSIKNKDHIVKLTRELIKVLEKNFNKKTTKDAVEIGTYAIANLAGYLIDTGFAEDQQKIKLSYITHLRNIIEQVVWTYENEKMQKH